MYQHLGAKQSRTRGSHSQPPLGETRKRQRHVKSHAVTTTHGTEKDCPSCAPFTEPDFPGIPLWNRCRTLPSAHGDCARCKEMGEKCPHGWAVSIGPKGKHTAVPHKGRRAGGCWQGSSCWCCTQPCSVLTFSGSPWHFNQINITEPQQAQSLWTWLVLEESKSPMPGLRITCVGGTRGKKTKITHQWCWCGTRLQTQAPGSQQLGSGCCMWKSPGHPPFPPFFLAG